VHLAPELLRCLQPKGVALVSGFERQETEAVQAALERHGARPLESCQKANWALLALCIR
jgi:ribosomal protein L11 methylase PrmA